MTKWLVQKKSEPETLGAAYVASLEVLEGDEKLIMSTQDGPIKVREMDTAEAEVVRARGHIALVEPDDIATIAEPEADINARRMSDKDAARFHKLHKVGGRGQGRKVAVIDTGCDERLYRRYSDRVVGRYDVFDDEDWRDHTSKHGSWCISTIIGNADQCEVLSYKALSTKTGSGPYSGVIDCIQHAIDQGATDMNLSLSGPTSEILDRAVKAAADSGINVFVAAGNEQRGSTRYEADLRSPSRVREAVTVAAVDSDGNRASFSDIGRAVDIAALGVAVRCPDSDLLPKFMSGTSMATPLAVATALCAGVSGKELVEGARDTKLSGLHEGSGFADALRAKKKARPAPPKRKPRRYQVKMTRQMSWKPSAEGLRDWINSYPDMPGNQSAEVIDNGTGPDNPPS